MIQHNCPGGSSCPSLCLAILWTKGTNNPSVNIHSRLGSSRSQLLLLWQLVLVTEASLLHHCSTLDNGTLWQPDKVPPALATCAILAKPFSKAQQGHFFLKIWRSTKDALNGPVHSGFHQGFIFCWHPCTFTQLGFVTLWKNLVMSI